MKGLKGKIAIVTASTAGIGLSIARRLAEEGATVVVSSRKRESVDAAVKQISVEGFSAYGITCHVGKAESRKALIEDTIAKFGRIDILVSNAAANPTYGPIIETDEATWDKVFDVNVKGAFLLAADVARIMAKQTSGSIVFVSSVAGYQPMPNLGVYSVSKTALLGLMQTLAAEWASLGIRVNAVAPGMVKTKFSEALWKNPKIEKKMTEAIPLRRFGLPDEIASAVCFLVSDEASYVHGETMIVSGGLAARL
mmetsp:Transcript_428/g.719  ORF Transcript_428/g.719 Transcript_428/m.719 type:complete len:253 (+) Transcript_428:141-899(+)|eukprot:CAMPEP_0184669912 /NCGR_PEP_ID=MMETSP0308-20130426/79684_1 /TAXON_ID=38269 /ORGANISM="Gloeochaete witrockiana, Strain SAG 46.84" /LENGTH=252 /DNA_ID=CAMNT_0027116401 /DNA_START=132 /DNA_END=890 /DNA_ORIENTATION=-